MGRVASRRTGPAAARPGWLACLALALLLTVAASALTPVARACSCMPREAGELLRSADVVFEGTAITATPERPVTDRGLTMPGVRTWTFDVDEVLKGDASSSVEVKAGVDGAACGFRFREGDRYRVYADAMDDGLWTGLCNGTEALQEPGPPVPAGHSIDSGDERGAPPGPMPSTGAAVLAARVAAGIGLVLGDAFAVVLEAWSDLWSQVSVRAAAR